MGVTRIHYYWEFFFTIQQLLHIWRFQYFWAFFKEFSKLYLRSIPNFYLQWHIFLRLLRGFQLIVLWNACVQDWVLKFSDESAAQSWSDKTGDLLRPYPEKDTSKSLRKIGKHATLHHTVYNLTWFFVHQLLG